MAHARALCAHGWSSDGAASRAGSNRGAVLDLRLRHQRLDAVTENPSEAVKCGFHLVAFGLCCTLFAHNFAGYLTRPNRENGLNAVVYGLGIAFEWSRAMRHFRRAL